MMKIAVFSTFQHKTHTLSVKRRKMYKFYRIYSLCKYKKLYFIFISLFSPHLTYIIFHHFIHNSYSCNITAIQHFQQQYDSISLYLCYHNSSFYSSRFIHITAHIHFILHSKKIYLLFFQPSATFIFHPSRSLGSRKLWHFTV